jgi:hypothetical protein
MSNELDRATTAGRRDMDQRLARAETAQAALLLRLWAAQLAQHPTEVPRLEARLLAAGKLVRALGGQSLASPAAFLPPRRRARGPRPPRRP